MMLATGSSRTFRYLAGKAIGFASAPVSAPASVMVVPSRGQYSRRTMWPPHFEEPEETKEGIKKLKDNEEFQRRLSKSVKSASNNATCSPLNDPILFRLEKAYMRGGRRQLSQNMLVSVTEKIKALQLPRYYKASEEKREAIPTDPVEIIKKAIENARPLMGIQKVQVGGVSYNVPVPIQESRAVFDALKWMTEAAADRPKKREQRFDDKLAEVIVETAAFVGPVIAKKHEHHKICEQNRAYAGFRKGA